MRVLVCGDRNWTDAAAIENRIAKLPSDSVIIEGGSPGADAIVGEIAERLGLGHVTYRAKWDVYGPAAGPMRNQQMLDEGQPDLVIAFQARAPETKGTQDMVERARKRGLPIEEYRE